MSGGRSLVFTRVDPRAFDLDMVDWGTAFAFDPVPRCCFCYYHFPQFRVLEVSSLVVCSTFGSWCCGRFDLCEEEESSPKLRCDLRQVVFLPLPSLFFSILLAEIEIPVSPVATLSTACFSGTFPFWLTLSCSFTLFSLLRYSVFFWNTPGRMPSPIVTKKPKKGEKERREAAM
ncbi:hypothetical protein KSP39_PZI014103 [Platanthera zijinensis]|uniref:Transmembrane protein n=1 Tax=Platanthera zijinensis TaxID=2320716 RepID=A0AAP0BBT6_9ASPA